MKKMRTNILVSIFILLPIFVFSNSQSYERKINWKGIQEISIDSQEMFKIMKFEGSLNEPSNQFLPKFFERFPLPNGTSDFTLEIRNQIFETMENNNLKEIQGLENIGNEISLENYTSFEQKKPWATISFVPIRKNELTGFYEKLVSFEILISPTLNNKSVSIGSNYVENSVLSEGNWYKIAIQNSGVHKITYQQLVDMGMNVGSINPKNIRIYGNGGSMLPEDPTQPRIDDLAENAIYVSGENDGVFNTDDYILFYGESPNVWNYSPVEGRFRRIMHLYSNYNYYFISADLGQG
jgi:hypothetical protein